jgi:hypothetical protein
VDATVERRAFDRRLYTTAAILFAVIVLVGFGRTYYLKALSGAPPLNALVHLHGLVMTAWVALFATQVGLISSKRVQLHRQLGYAGVGLAVLVVLVGVPTALRAAKYGSASTPQGIAPLGFMIVPVFDLLMFVLLFGAAVYYRRTPSVHKSLMLLTAINFLPPALGRIPLPSLRALGPLWFFGVPTALALLCLWLDARRRGRVNRWLAGGTALLVASYVARMALMTTGAWMAVAAWLTTFV